jgi:tetratricopeptide (TPR) repeat protein
MANMDWLERELKEAKEYNRQWNVKYSYLEELHRKAGIIEKQGDLYEAIDAYNMAIEYGKIEFNYNFYARDVERLIILYRKTKQYQLEVELITFILKNDISKSVRAKYKERLNRVKQLIKN